ncbi:MAG: hypothetical protein M9920_04490 [Verrucomicrobiae bacterium]|nr:hypothetical protein [Verrucomicrobiae bacterium]
MTKAIWVLIIFFVVYVGYLLFQQWDQARLEHEGQQRESAVVVTGESLSGMPVQLELSYRDAKGRGAAAFQEWFKQNERFLSDPRKAWIEVELCKMLIRENPSEAKKIYAAVKERVSSSSPVYEKVKELEKTFGP